jgi:2-polyprenyl-6-methoxyphenol hydroxylase-like FAD-dependent oxidoreductase
MNAVRTPSHRRAIVIGASMTGLAVARALSGHFREVLVIERDVLSRELPEHRPGVPQSWHIHNLTLRGQMELEALFPGYVEEAVALGAMQLDYGRDVARCTEYGFQKQFESGLIALSATRILLEFAERRRFFALMKNATLIEGTRVVDLITELVNGTQRAVGVRTDNPEARELRADLVIDCSGRATRWKKWFEARGIALPKETVVDSRAGYSSRFYKPHNPDEFRWKALVVDGTYPEHQHWGVIVPLENKQWVVTLGGLGGNYPPSDEEGFLACARTLLTPHYAEALQRAEPLTPVRTFRRMEMRWSHFEKYRGGIDRFLVIGDAAWAYNPLFGQGMSIGVTCARVLRDVLDENPRLEHLSRRYYPRAKKFAFPPWESTALLDMRWPNTVGKRPWYAQLSYKLFDFAWHASHYDDAIIMAVIEGAHLLKQPHELLTPRVLWGFARFALRRFTLNRLPPMPRLPAGAN